LSKHEGGCSLWGKRRGGPLLKKDNQQKGRGEIIRKNDKKKRVPGQGKKEGGTQ